MSILPRRRSIPVQIGAVTVGGNAPVAVQSMTNTDTADVESTVRQVQDLARAGSELVRITVNSDEAAAAVPHIASGWRAPVCSCRWSAISISTAIVCSRRTRHARKRWRSTASIRATSGAAASAIRSSPR